LTVQITLHTTVAYKLSGIVIFGHFLTELT